MNGGIRINKIRILTLATLILTLFSCVGAAAEIVVHSGQSIQSAVNSANNGDTIIVEPGTYTENVVINLKNDLLIRSTNEGTASTVIAANDSNINVIALSNCNNVTIQGLNITGAGTDRSGIYVLNSLNCKIKDNIMHDDALGIYIRGSGYTVVSNNTATKSLPAGMGRAINIHQSDYTIVSNNRVSNNYYGIYITASQANRVLGNTVNLSVSSGIVMENASNVTLENNNLNSNGVYGIYLRNSNGNFMRNNNVFNSTNNSFEIYSSSGNEITGNTVSDNSIDTLTHGIHLNTAHNNILRSNTISNNDYGIAMIYSNNNDVVNNTASGNNRGIYLAYTSSTNTLSDNKVHSNIYGGIVLQNCSNNNIVNNKATLNTGGSTTNGIIIGGASNNNVSNNDVSGNRRGIYITSTSSGNKVSGNTLNSNSGHGILLENAGSNNNITGNTISSNGGVGIYLVNSNNTYVLNNVAPSNLRGIEVSTTNESVISNNTASNSIASGIRVSLSNNNTISGNRVQDNSYFGIELNSSIYNNISSNNINKNIEAGMFLCAQSKYNLIYNNYLNNVRNTNNNNTECTWNISKTQGENIAGGSNLGGNFWGNPVLKNGHSQLYANNDSDGDGIIDIVYNGDKLIDYLPLKEIIVVLPEADFTTNVSSGDVPLTVQFTDLSKNTTGWSWNFGDGNSSTDRNTTHTYSAAGTYTVTLTASNVNGTATKTAVITATNAPGPDIILPDASFTASLTSGRKPLTVLFTDTSQSSTSRSWDVNGDGVEDSNETSFTYTYNFRGTYAATLTAINANGTDRETIEIDVRGDSGGGGGGGGGGGSPEPAKNVEVKELAQAFVTNGKAIQFDFTKNATCVSYVNFDSKKTAGKITTIVEQLKNKSTLTSNLTEGEVYKHFNVWVGNSGFATSGNIENPGICFKVEKSWLQDKNIDQDSITLNRYNDKKWEQLPASLLKEDSKYLYFTADVSGYSFFAVTGKAKASSPEESFTEIEPEDEPATTGNSIEDTGSEAGNESTPGVNTGMPGFEIVCGIAGLSAAFLHRRK